MVVQGPTSFSNPGWSPLVLDPVVAGVQPTKVLIDGSIGLNIIFASMPKKMGLGIINLLTPTDEHFNGIVPGKVVIPLG